MQQTALRHAGAALCLAVWDAARQGRLRTERRHNLADVADCLPSLTSCGSAKRPPTCACGLERIAPSPMEER